MKKFILMFVLGLLVFNAPAFAGWGWGDWGRLPSSMSKRIATNESKIKRNEATIREVRIRASEAFIKSAENESRIEQAESNIETINDKLSGSSDSTIDIRNVYANGALIGTTIVNYFQPFAMEIVLTFKERFGAGIVNNAGLLTENSTLYFDESDCGGSAYMMFGSIDSETEFGFPLQVGRVTTYNGNIYFYEGNEQNVYKKIMLSWGHDTSCSNIIPAPTEPNALYLKLKLNDPAITGIYEYPFPLPITIEGINPVGIIEE